MTPSGIEPATFQLKQLRHRVHRAATKQNDCIGIQTKNFSWTAVLNWSRGGAVG
jgi:hypothetical protein